MVKISYRPYDTANQQNDTESVKGMISHDLSEPYSVYVYRYFISSWPNLCFLAFDEDEEEKQADGSMGKKAIGTVVCKLEDYRGCRSRGYIAMLAVKTDYRGQGIAKKLIDLAIAAMVDLKADEIMLETEVNNAAAMSLYENIGFVRTKRLHRYYLNSNDAFRLILPITDKSCQLSRYLVHSEEAAPQFPSHVVI